MILHKSWTYLAPRGAREGGRRQALPLSRPSHDALWGSWGGAPEAVPRDARGRWCSVTLGICLHGQRNPGKQKCLLASLSYLRGLILLPIPSMLMPPPTLFSSHPTTSHNLVRSSASMYPSCLSQRFSNVRFSRLVSFQNFRFCFSRGKMRLESLNC